MSSIKKFSVVMLCFLPLTMQAMMPVEQPIMPIGRTELAVGVAAGAAGIFFLIRSYKLLKNLFQNKYASVSNTVSYRDGSGKIVTTAISEAELSEHRLSRNNVVNPGFVRGPVTFGMHAGPGWKTHGAIWGSALCFAIGLSAVAYSLSTLLRWRVAGLSS